MRLKLKYVLPLVQTLVAVALLVWTYRWERALMRVQDMPGTPPSFSLLIAINAPLAMPRALVSLYLPGWWDYITLIAVIGLLWYWVALNIDSWRHRRTIFTFSWLPLRLAVDAVAVGIGGVLTLVSWQSIFHGYLRFSWGRWVWFVTCMGLFLAWAAVLIFCFGRDLLHCILRRTS
jgi:hypothetical protein